MTASSSGSEVSAVFAIRAAPCTALAALGTGLRREIAALAVLPGISRAVVNIADVDPGGARWDRPGEEHEAVAYQAVVELSARNDAFAGVAASVVAAVQPYADTIHGWRVTRMPARLETDPPPPGSPSPGTKYIVFCKFHPDLPDSAAGRSWEHHVGLALRIHEGAARYVRVWIDAPLTAQAPSFQGITELCFRTREDMEQRWFCNEHGRSEIIQDIGHFLHSGVRLYTTEHVIKDLNR